MLMDSFIIICLLLNIFSECLKPSMDGITSIFVMDFVHGCQTKKKINGCVRKKEKHKKMSGQKENLLVS